MAVAAAEEGEKDASQGVDVGAVVGCGASFLFGSGKAVAAGAVLEGGVLWAVAEAEIDELEAAVVGDDDIRRLDVVVVDAVVVEIIDGIEQLGEHRAGVGGRLPLPPLVEGLTLHPFHHDASAHHVVVLEAFHADDSGMVERDPHAVFLVEPLVVEGVAAQLVADALEHIPTAVAAGAEEHVHGATGDLLIVGEERLGDAAAARDETRRAIDEWRGVIGRIGSI